MATEVIHITAELAKWLEDNAYPDVQSYVYTEANLPEPEAYYDSIFCYKGFTAVCFQASSQDCYFAFSPTHTTLSAKAETAEQAVDALELAVDRLLGVRGLTNHEEQVNQAMTQALTAVLTLSAKDGVAMLAKVILSVYGPTNGGKDSANLIAAKVVASNKSVTDVVANAAQTLRLKYSGIIGCKIESILTQITG